MKKKILQLKQEGMICHSNMKKEMTSEMKRVYFPIFMLIMMYRIRKSDYWTRFGQSNELRLKDWIFIFKYSFSVDTDKL